MSASMAQRSMGKQALTVEAKGTHTFELNAPAASSQQHFVHDNRLFVQAVIGKSVVLSVQLGMMGSCA